jgi:hypothetical protein
VRIHLAAAVLSCLAAAGVSGCGQRGSACGVQDVGVGGPVYQTPRQALDSVLAQHQQWLSTTGWVAKDQSAGGVTFTAGNDSVDVLKNKAGQWVVAGITACE